MTTEETETDAFWTRHRTNDRGRAEAQYRKWGATEVRFIEDDELDLVLGQYDDGSNITERHWGRTEASALCLMPDGKWYSGHEGAWLDRRDGYVAANGDEAVRLHRIAGAEREVRYARERLTTALAALDVANAP